MKTTGKVPQNFSIKRLSNKNEAKKISSGVYYYLDFETKEIYYFDYRNEKNKIEKKFNNFTEFDKFVNKEFK